MVSCSRHPDQRQHSTQCQVRTHSLNRSKQPSLPIVFRDAESVEGEVRHLEGDDNELQETEKSGDSPPQNGDFLLESNGVHVECVDGYDIGTRILQPSSGRRPRHAVAHGEVKIVCGLNKTAKAMVVSLLGASRGSHPSILTSIAL